MKRTDKSKKESLRKRILQKTVRAIAAIIVAFVLVLGLRTGMLEYKLRQPQHVVGDCFIIETQLTIFRITGLKNGNYVVSGIVLFFPFSKLMTIRELNKMLHEDIAEQIDCETGEPLGEKDEKNPEPDSNPESK